VTGADIITALLRQDSAGVAMTPIEWIKMGQLPATVTLPVLLVRVVSSSDRQPLKWTPQTRMTDRVSVTVRADTYRDQVKAMKLVRAACGGRTGDIADARAVSVLTAGKGPDLSGPGNTFEQACDFRVSFIDPA
jgi:hypothetical protein